MCQIQTQHHSCVLKHMTILQQAVVMVMESGGLPSNPQWMELAMEDRTASDKLGKEESLP